MSQIESLTQIEEKLNNLSLTAKNNIDNSNTHEELDQLRVSLLGKKGDLSVILKTMGQLSASDRPIVGPQLVYQKQIIAPLFSRLLTNHLFFPAKTLSIDPALHEY